MGRPSAIGLAPPPPTPTQSEAGEAAPPTPSQAGAMRGRLKALKEKRQSMTPMLQTPVMNGVTGRQTRSQARRAAQTLSPLDDATTPHGATPH